MKKYNVAILGATGMVGREMIKILQERNFPIQTLTLLASAKSAGKTISFHNQQLIVEVVTEESFHGIDYVLIAVNNELSKHYSLIAVKHGAVVIDNSSAFRLDKDVPLIIPEVNPQDIHSHKGILSNPNCSTIIALVAIQALHEYAHVSRIILSTYQAVSGAGIGGLEELSEQIQTDFDFNKIEPKVFPYQIAFNVIPQIGKIDEHGDSVEELKLQNEARKILHHPTLKVCCTCVRVPVYRCHSESITLEFDNEISKEKAQELLSKANGVCLLDDPSDLIYPMPINTSNQDLVTVGRIREDLSNLKKGLTLFCCGDQIRKGAATNAIQIMELLIKK